MNELFYGSLRIIVVDIRLNGHYDWTLWIIVGHYDPYQQICGHYEWTGDYGSLLLISDFSFGLETSGSLISIMGLFLSLNLLVS